MSAAIGPNAITQIDGALRGVLAEDGIDALFDSVGLLRYRAAPPTRMVAEDEVAALHQALRRHLPREQAARVARDAGARTAQYLLAHRIPRPLQWVLRHLPAAVAARVLLAAIRRHAWTFAGSGRFEAQVRRRVRVTLAGCPLCRSERAAMPVCDFYAATFTGLFRALVHPDATARETECAATGASACVFDIGW